MALLSFSHKPRDGSQERKFPYQFYHHLEVTAIASAGSLRET
jgi:hypothetical protein